MNKILMMLASFACVLCVRAEDSYMYWMIDEDWTVDGATYDSGDYSARVSAFNSSSGIWLTPVELAVLGSSDGSLSSVADNSVALNGSGNTLFYSAFSNGYTGDDWNYYVEIYSADNLIGRSDDHVTYTTAQQAGYIRSSASSLKPGVFMAVSSFSSPVPEPTSGLLMLIGSAALALRRRKIRV